MAERRGRTTVEWATARGARGSPADAAATGDMAVVHQTDGRVVAGVIDGSGRGPEAAHAARLAAAVMAGSAADDVAVLARRCHVALGSSRGAAMSVAVVAADTGSMTWLGVGNVEGRLLRPAASGVRSSASLRLPGGVLGHQLPPLRPTTLPIGLGDLLLFATDGVRSSFADGLAPVGTCQAIADRIIGDHWKGPDDALALVVRYLGPAT